MESRKQTQCRLPGLPLSLLVCALTFLSNQRGVLSLSLGSITVQSFGNTTDGQQVDMYTLSWGRASADILTFGATLRALRVPDSKGDIDDVVTGFDTLDPYLTQKYRFGCLKGRVSTVLTGNSITLNNQTYNISGSGNDLCYQVYKATPSQTSRGISVRLEYNSTAGQNGFPGNLRVSATYMLSWRGRAAALTLRIRATTDNATYVNIIHHPYFNLGGHKPENLTTTGLQNEAHFNADRYTPVNSTTKVPDGTILSVTNTPFDLQAWTAIGDALNNFAAQTLVTGSTTLPSYDDYFVLKSGTRIAAKFRHPPSGRKLTMGTNQPGFIFFTGHRLNNTIGKGGVPYTRYSFYAIESSAYRDAPNQPNFPSILLLPGDTYKHDISYVLSA